ANRMSSWIAFRSSLDDESARSRRVSQVRYDNYLQGKRTERFPLFSSPHCVFFSVPPAPTTSPFERYFLVIVFFLTYSRICAMMDFCFTSRLDRTHRSLKT